jgi:hypothetical protein
MAELGASGPLVPLMKFGTSLTDLATGVKNSNFPRRSAIDFGINVQSLMTLTAQSRVQPISGSILVNPRLSLVLVPVLALELLLLGISGT